MGSVGARGSSEFNDAWRTRRNVYLRLASLVLCYRILLTCNTSRSLETGLRDADRAHVKRNGGGHCPDATPTEVRIRARRNLDYLAQPLAQTKT